MSIRVLMVDDHRMFREGLRAVLERDPQIEVVGEAADGREAVEAATGRLAPDVVVLDIGMPGLNGAEAARQISARKPGIKIVALSAHNDRRFVVNMLEAGASGYVLKEAASEEILAAIHAVRNNRKFLSPAIVGLVVESWTGRHRRKGGDSPLSAREREVVQLLAEGKTSKEMAALLHLSPKTIETHRRNIMRKLKLRSVAALTKFAIREGLTSADE